MKHTSTFASTLAILVVAAATAPADVIDDLGGDVIVRLRASDLAQADGTPVTAWGSLTQGTAADQPTYVASGFNGQAVVSFDGTGDNLSGGTATGARTIFAIASLDSSGAASLAGLISNDNDRLNVRRDGTNERYRDEGAGGDDNEFYRHGGVVGEFGINGGTSSDITYGTPHLLRAEAGQAANYTDLTLGRAAPSGGAANRFWQGDIAEVVIIDRTLTINETYAVMQHLGNTYGVTIASRGTILGTGNGALVGGDSTDPENDGAADTNTNYNVVQFIGNNEAFFGGAEGAFNVFDNRTGGGADKWCCDGIVSGGSFVGAEFFVDGRLDRFTATSSNDSPVRDAIHWAIQGSNDGTAWTDVFVQDADTTIWTARSQTILFEAGVDYDVTGNFSWYRYIAYETGGSNHALGELEFFVIPAPAALPAGLVLITLAAARRRRK